MLGSNATVKCYGQMLRSNVTVEVTVLRSNATVECYGRMLRCYGRMLRSNATVECYGAMVECYGRMLRCYGRMLRCFGRMLWCYGRMLRSNATVECYGATVECYGWMLRYFSPAKQVREKSGRFQFVVKIAHKTVIIILISFYVITPMNGPRLLTKQAYAVLCFFLKLCIHHSL